MATACTSGGPGNDVKTTSASEATTRGLADTLGEDDEAAEA